MARKSPGVARPGITKLNVRMDVDLQRRIKATAAMKGEPVDKMVSDILDAHFPVGSISLNAAAS